VNHFTEVEVLNKTGRLLNADMSGYVLSDAESEGPARELRHREYVLLQCAFRRNAQTHHNTMVSYDNLLNRVFESE
jgi:hypothetical protein